tara:strand:- start:1663 stop:2592 length:930 start_codon:yes stop_codon:yes gene_type:complete
MKKLLYIFLFLGFILILYSVFIDEKMEYVAGEYRYYVPYERIFEQEKNYISTTAYDNDKYKLNNIRDKAIEYIDEIEKKRVLINSLRQSIYSNSNEISDYEKYTESLKKIYEEIESENRKIDGQKAYLDDLKEYIEKYENQIISINFYNQDISNIKNSLQSLDTITSNYKDFINQSILIASVRGIKKIEDYKKQKEKEYQERLAQIEFEKQMKEADQLLEESRYKYYNTDALTNYSSYPSYNLPSMYNTSTNNSVNPKEIKVDAYYRDDGTYVPSHYRTVKNQTQRDNYTSKPNYNPYTGKKGYIKPEY